MFTQEAIAVIAKFPLVVIEKGMDLSGAGYAETKISATCEQVKVRAPGRLLLT